MNERLKQLRSVLNITLEEFGKKVGITRSAVGRLEKGEREWYMQNREIVDFKTEFSNEENEMLSQWTGGT